ncbi:hypothetical protein [Sphingomonas sp. ABOLE]|uniref:hypothetical protein n=1 Tax=Sphingomonas sp. ABOLE TaxID=1985878 RepID=UPI000F7E9CA0|nr:hypothetical protein [Sphingomonas sp. ABOLE]
MFDTSGAFKKQFTRVEGGYLVYPSRKIGGKLISDEEYDHLIKGWERAAGRTGRWKAIGIIIAVIALWTLLSDLVSVPEWGESLLVAAIVLGVCAWFLWASTTPRRLVSDRPAITPPRGAAEARRDARAALNWPFVVFALILSGAIFFGSVTANDRSPGAWAWLIGSGVMSGLYVWIAIKKLTDRMR